MNMTINFIEPGDDARRKKIEKILPKQTIVKQFLEPEIEKKLFKTLAECIRKEVEIYREFPRKKSLKDKPVEDFDPRNNGTCFMGKKFKANGDGITDYDLDVYRKAIGTIHHPVWGDCTLLEIWGGDHFEENFEMVRGVFDYGMKLSDVCPEIVVKVNPLFKNDNSKEFLLSEAQQKYMDEQEELLARAMVFGVRTPAQARASRKRR